VLIQTHSVPDAIRQLQASGIARKALIITSSAGTQTLPEGMFILRTEANMARKAVVEACNQYSIGFPSLDPSATVDVALKQPRGLPTLKANVWK
jgi:hypothetical protein